MHRLRKLAGVPAQVRAGAAMLAGRAPQSRHPFQNRNRRPCRRSLTLNGWTSCSARLSKLGSSPHCAKPLASRLASRLLPPLWSHRLCLSLRPPPPTGLPQASALLSSSKLPVHCTAKSVSNFKADCCLHTAHPGWLAMSAADPLSWDERILKGFARLVMACVGLTWRCACIAAWLLAWIALSVVRFSFCTVCAVLCLLGLAVMRADSSGSSRGPTRACSMPDGAMPTRPMHNSSTRDGSSTRGGNRNGSSRSGAASTSAHEQFGKNGGRLLMPDMLSEIEGDMLSQPLLLHLCIMQRVHFALFLPTWRR